MSLLPSKAICYAAFIFLLAVFFGLVIRFW